MKMLLFPRGAGKTALAIRESAQDQIPIVCFNEAIASDLQRRAKKKGFSIPKPISIRQLFNSGSPPPKVIIDNLDTCLSNIIPITEIVMATMTI